MMTNNWFAALIGVFVLAVNAPAALAQADQPVELTSEVKVDTVVVEDGKERHVLVEPKVVVPGDHLVFATGYSNKGAEAVKDFVVVNPIPEGVLLASEEATRLELSVDGGKSWGKLAALRVADWMGGERPAQVSDATHVRWTLATVAPGASGTLTYKATVR